MSSRPRLYAFHLPNPAPFEDYEYLLALLSPPERDRVQRYRLAEDRLRSLISRIALWYHLLVTKRRTPADDPPSIRSGLRGKPYLTTKIAVASPAAPDQAETSELHDQPELGVEDGVLRVGFNVSHEGNWVLLGVVEVVAALEPTVASGSSNENAPGGAEIEIGVDVMVPPSDSENLKEALIPQMTLSERQALSVSLTPSQLRWTLSALWALKEGYTKAVGDGVGFGLERINVDFTSDTPPSNRITGPSTPGALSAPRMETSLPVNGVKVDGVDVRYAGWQWAVGTLGEPNSLDQVGWAMYWPDSRPRAARHRADGSVESHGPDVHVIEWEDVTTIFDRAPSYEQRKDSRNQQTWNA